MKSLGSVRFRKDLLKVYFRKTKHTPRRHVVAVKSCNRSHNHNSQQQKGQKATKGKGPKVGMSALHLGCDGWFQGTPRLLAHEVILINTWLLYNSLPGVHV